LVEIFKTTNALRSRIKDIPDTGLVPTLGNLHEGHLKLVRESLKQNQTTIVTIFVNPTQFGKNEDLDSYPKTLQEDLEKLYRLNRPDEKNLIAFAPSSEKELYPIKPNVIFSIPHLEKKLCDLNRPGHFNGVMQIIYRLFKLIEPNQAYFGEKDYQQLLIIKCLAEEFFSEIKINSVPIVREVSGLAMSSRNNYLSDDEKKDALILPKTLTNLQEDFINLKNNCITSTQESINKLIKKDPRWQYLELLDAVNLGIPSTKSKKLILAGAYKVNSVKLIDNTVFNL
jgi:pantoate--beta-alanine ligase